MEHSNIRAFTRTILTVTGIVLLVIFGARAASQASSVAAVGGKPERALYPTNLAINRIVELETGFTDGDMFTVALAANSPTVATQANKPADASRKSASTVAVVARQLQKAKAAAVATIENTDNPGASVVAGTPPTDTSAHGAVK